LIIGLKCCEQDSIGAKSAQDIGLIRRWEAEELAKGEKEE